MKDYSKGKIYAIRSHKTDLIYIGSTVQPLYKRMDVHRSNYKRYINTGKSMEYSYKIFDLDDKPYIELVINYPCSCLDELRREEGIWIRKMDCVNKNIAGRTPKERYEHKKEEILKKSKERYKNNKEEILKKDKEYRDKNKDKIQKYKKEYYEQTKNHKLQKFACPCGGKYTRCHKTKHEKTGKHQQYIKSGKN